MQAILGLHLAMSFTESYKELTGIFPNMYISNADQFPRLRISPATVLTLTILFPLSLKILLNSPT